MRARLLAGFSASVAPFQELLADRAVRRIVWWSLIARLPTGMNMLCLILFMQAKYKNFEAGGYAAGVFFVTCAVFAPAIGRHIDQYGPRLMIWLTTAVHCAALTGLALIDMPLWLLLGVVGLAGALSPPCSSVMRAMWRKMPMREAQRQTAYALDSVILELMFIGGPLVVSLVLLFSEARYGLLISAALILFGMTGFVRSGGIRLWGEVEQGVARNWFGPLQSPGFLYSLLAMLFYGTATALAEMAMPIFATQMGQTSLVSLYYVVMSISSATGGIMVGAHVFKRPVIEQLLIAGVIGVVTYGAMGMVTVFKVPAIFALLCFFAGFSIGPFISLMFTVSMVHVPAQYATEAMTWVTTALLIGLGLGYAIAGGLSDRYGLRALLLVTLIPSCLAVACVWGIHTRLRHHDAKKPSP